MSWNQWENEEHMNGERIFLFAILFIGIGFVLVSITYAASSTKYAGTATDLADGDGLWANKSNVLGAGDGVLTTGVSDPVTGGGFTDTLKLTGYGFAIPSGATIDGIEASVHRKASLIGTNYETDLTIQIVKGGSLTGTNKADTSLHIPTTLTTKTYGSVTDKWGSTWTTSDINSANFGIAIQFQSGGLLTQRITMSVDYVSITVHYTSASDPCQPPASHENWTLPCGCNVTRASWSGHRINVTGGGTLQIDSSNITVDSFEYPIYNCTMAYNGSYLIGIKGVLP